MTPTPDIDRKSKEREKKRKAGFRPHEVWVHKLDWDYVQALVEMLAKKRMKKPT